jgi:hypothetical protein
MEKGDKVFFVYTDQEAMKILSGTVISDKYHIEGKNLIGIEAIGKPERSIFTTYVPVGRVFSILKNAEVCFDNLIDDEIERLKSLRYSK